MRPSTASPLGSGATEGGRPLPEKRLLAARLVRQIWRDLLPRGRERRNTKWPPDPCSRESRRRSRPAKGPELKAALSSLGASTCARASNWQAWRSHDFEFQPQAYFLRTPRPCRPRRASTPPHGTGRSPAPFGRRSARIRVRAGSPSGQELAAEPGASADARIHVWTPRLRPRRTTRRSRLLDGRPSLSCRTLDIIARPRYRNEHHRMQRSHIDEHAEAFHPDPPGAGGLQGGGPYRAGR